MLPGKNSDYPFQTTLGPTHELFRCFRRAPLDVFEIGTLDRQRPTPGLRTCRPPCVNFSIGVDRNDYRERPPQPSNVKTGYRCASRFFLEAGYVPEAFCQGCARSIPTGPPVPPSPSIY